MSNTKYKIPLDGLAGLKENFSKDAVAGFLVFLLALPLSLGIAKASDFPLIFGLVTAIIGGVVVSFFSGSILTIKGPAAGLIVICSEAVSEFGEGVTGWHLALGAICVAAILQIIFGIIKLGKLSDFFPSAVVHGMLAAIGIMIMAKQIHSLLGVNPAYLAGVKPLQLIQLIPHSIMHNNAPLREIGVTCLCILIIFSFIKNKFISKIPSPLIVLLVAIPMGIALNIKAHGITQGFAMVKVGKISEAFKHGLINVDFSGFFSHTGIFLKYVMLFALIGSIESLLTAKAIDGMDPYKRIANFNKDLYAVGIGNVLSSLIGGLPMISEVARSSANVAYGAQTRWANFFHGIFLLLAVLFAVPIIEMIPNAALAAMLTFVGFKLAHPKEFVHMWHIGKEQFIIFVSTIIVTLLTDLLAGVAFGIIVKMFIHLLNGSKFMDMLQANFVIEHTEEIIYVKIKGVAVFTNLIPLKNKLGTLPQAKKIIIDVSNTKLVDHTTLVTLNNIVEIYEREGGSMKIEGFEKHKQLSHSPTSARVLKQ